MTGVGADDGATNEFGANEWLVDEMYEQYLVDKDSVDRSWWPILEHYRPVNGAAQGTTGGQSDDGAASVGTTAPAPAPAASDEAARVNPPTAPIQVIGAQPVARTTSVQAKPAPIPADAPMTSPNQIQQPKSDQTEPAPEDVDKVTVLKGMAKSLATNMDASLTVPTATSVRTIPAKLMIDNRIVINNHLKLSLIHI